MELNFKGKRALVTGAGKGIGRGIAIKLAECGAQVVAISRTPADLDSLRVKIPTIETHIVDLTDWDATRKVLETIDPVELLVNNAGASVSKEFLDVTKESLYSLFDINFMAAFNVSQVIAKSMIDQGKGGAIVMVSSILSSVASQARSCNCCSKAALDQLARCLALELGPYQIRVNSVNPTVVLSQLAIAHGWDNPEKASRVTSRTPLGRLAEVEDIVNTTLFLLSDTASMINGATIPVDGGLTTHI